MKWRNSPLSAASAPSRYCTVRARRRCRSSQITIAANFGDIAFFQVHEAVSDLAQGQLVGGEEVLTQAQADHQRAATARGDQTIRLVALITARP
jgi:hypothetical protein